MKLNILLEYQNKYYELYWIKRSKIGIIGWTFGIGILGGLNIKLNTEIFDTEKFETHFNYPLDGRLHITHVHSNKSGEVEKLHYFISEKKYTYQSTCSAKDEQLILKSAIEEYANKQEIQEDLKIPTLQEFDETATRFSLPSIGGISNLNIERIKETCLETTPTKNSIVIDQTYLNSPGITIGVDLWGKKAKKPNVPNNWIFESRIENVKYPNIEIYYIAGIR